MSMNTPGSADHVAIYIGNGQIAHAANRRDGLCTGYLSDYSTKILGVKRVF